MPSPAAGIAQLREELAATKAELAATERRRVELQTKAESLEGRLAEAQAARARAEAAAEGMRHRAEQAEADLKQVRQALEQVQRDSAAQAAELGRLRAISETVDALKAERDSLQQSVSRLSSDVERQVAEAVRSALTQAAQGHEAAAAEWTKERDALRSQLDELRRRLEQGGVVGHIAPTNLASKFAKVLEDLAEGKPTTERPFSAALTGLEVEARGVLEAPREGEEEPRFVTVEAGKVDPGQLSTMRMTFRLLPRVVRGPTE